jgi:hypothetical protein
MVAKKLGTNFNFCRNTGTFGSPVFPIAANCKDVKLNLEPSGKFDASDRSSTMDSVIPTRYKASVEFGALWDGGTFLTAVRTAFLAGTSLLGAVLDGTTSARGIHGEWAVTEFPIEAPLRDGQPIKITLQPYGNFANAMVFTSGAATTGADTVGTKKLGTNAVVHDGTNAITAFDDVKFSLAPSALFDSSDRSVLFDTVIPTRFKASAEAGFLWDPSDAKLLLFWTKFIANPQTAYDLYFLDGPKATAGSWGLFGSWAITTFPIDGQLRDGQRVKLGFEPHGNGSNAVVTYTDPGP